MFLSHQDYHQPYILRMCLVWSLSFLNKMVEVGLQMSFLECRILGSVVWYACLLTQEII